ncbi:MAG: hypothetical protein ACI9I4_001766, partial [Neolewinella sp.]
DPDTPDISAPSDFMNKEAIDYLFFVAALAVSCNILAARSAFCNSAMGVLITSRFWVENCAEA